MMRKQNKKQKKIKKTSRAFFNKDDDWDYDINIADSKDRIPDFIYDILIGYTIINNGI